MEELERIKITLSEVQDSRVDELVARDEAARRPTAPANREPPKVPLYYNPMLIYAIAGGLGALGAWSAIEPFIQEGRALRDLQNPKPEYILALIALFPVMGATIGLMVAVSDALLSRNLSRAAFCGAIGLGVGLLAGTIGIFAGGFCYGIIRQVGFSIFPPHPPRMGGPALFVQMVARALAWTIVATGMGLGQGIALKSKKLVLNGLVGALIGGFLGGLLFDPIDLIFGGSGSAATSRCVGMTTIGVAVGFFTGLVESMAKDAWLYMKAGPLAGKQFVIYKDPTILGSSPKCDVYLFKDAAIEPKHAELRAIGPRYQIKDLGTAQGVYVNGKRVESHVLQSGDTVVLGETVLEYASMRNTVQRPRKSARQL